MFHKKYYSLHCSILDAHLQSSKSEANWHPSIRHRKANANRYTQHAGSHAMSAWKSRAKYPC